jgi:hypothetical protein
LVERVFVPDKVTIDQHLVIWKHAW